MSQSVRVPLPIVRRGGLDGIARSQTVEAGRFLCVVNCAVKVLIAAIMPNTIRGQRIGCGGAGRERTKLKISC